MSFEFETVRLPPTAGLYVCQTPSHSGEASTFLYWDGTKWRMVGRDLTICLMEGLNTVYKKAVFGWIGPIPQCEEQEQEMKRMHEKLAHAREPEQNFVYLGANQRTWILNQLCRDHNLSDQPIELKDVSQLRGLNPRIYRLWLPTGSSAPDMLLRRIIEMHEHRCTVHGIDPIYSIVRY